MMDSFLLLLFAFLLGWVSCIVYSTYKFKKFQYSVYENYKRIAEEQKKRERSVKVEVVQGALMAYNATNNNQFLCKFDSLDDLTTQLSRIDPKIVWSLSQNDVDLIKNHVKYKDLIDG